MAEQTRAPTSDEAVSGSWTGSAGSRFGVVDDYPDTAGTDELTHGTTAGNLTFGFSAFTVPAGSTITAVQVDYYDFKNGSQGCNFGGRLKVGASYFNATTHNPGNGSGNRTQRTDTWATNPAGGSWTVDQINGTAGSNNLVAFGYVSTDANPTITTSSVQLRVTYDPPAGREGTLDASIGDITLAATGSVSVNGALAASIGDVTLSATGSVGVTGILDASIGDVTLAATGATGGPQEPREGVLLASVGEVTLSATGSVSVNGALATSIGEVTLAATGSVLVSGVLAASIGDVTLAATGTSGEGGGDAGPTDTDNGLNLGIGLGI